MSEEVKCDQCRNAWHWLPSACSAARNTHSQSGRLGDLPYDLVFALAISVFLFPLASLVFASLLDTRNSQSLFILYHIRCLCLCFRFIIYYLSS